MENNSVMVNICVNSIKRFLFTLCIFCCVLLSTSKGQDRLRKNNKVYIEVGALSALGINYERSFYFNDKFGSSLGIGVNSIVSGYLVRPVLAIRAVSFFEIGKLHKVRIGAGIADYPYRVYHPDKKVILNDILVLGIIGYNFSFSKNKFDIGFTINPLIYFTGAPYYLPTSFGWGGLNFGFKF